MSADLSPEQERALDALARVVDPSSYYSATWEPEQTLRMFRSAAKMRREARAEKKDGPSRNGPCSCGSGKKYKRCCGAG